ncbi:hypothetical protein DENSPDRAFT_845593 [Dentipellis sp. KUC8613]|nr:hypothetical protein DENSPDRAFT_845593 [Dentipellis sp. KUC8613]
MAGLLSRLEQPKFLSDHSKRLNLFLELAELIGADMPDNWKACFELNVPKLLGRILMDRRTNADPELSARVLSLLAYIVNRVFELERYIKQPIVEQLLSWSNLLFQVLVAMRDTIRTAVTQSRPHPSDGVLNLVAAYGRLYRQRDNYPQLLPSHFGILVIYAWAHYANRSNSGGGTTLQIFDRMLMHAPDQVCVPFRKLTTMGGVPPDTLAARFNDELQREDLDGEMFGACLRTMCFFGGAGDHSILPVLVTHDVYRSLYDALLGQRKTISREVEWKAICMMPGLLWTMFARCVRPSSPETFRHMEYLLAFMARAAVLAPKFDRPDGTYTEQWTGLCSNVCAFLRSSPGAPDRAFMVETIRRYWTPTVGYLSAVHVRATENSTRMLVAWRELGLAIGMERAACAVAMGLPTSK